MRSVCCVFTGCKISQEPVILVGKSSQIPRSTPVEKIPKSCGVKGFRFSDLGLGCRAWGLEGLILVDVILIGFGFLGSIGCTSHFCTHGSSGAQLDQTVGFIYPIRSESLKVYGPQTLLYRGFMMSSKRLRVRVFGFHSKVLVVRRIAPAAGGNLP